MQGKLTVDYDAIPEDTRQWLGEIRAIWHKSPRVCNIPHRLEEETHFMEYSIDYLVNTPLEVIKQKREAFTQSQGYDALGEAVT